MFAFKSGSQKKEGFDTFRLCVGLEIHKKTYNENEIGRRNSFVQWWSSFLYFQ